MGDNGEKKRMKGDHLGIWYIVCSFPTQERRTSQGDTPSVILSGYQGGGKKGFQSNSGAVRLSEGGEKVFNSMTNVTTHQDLVEVLTQEIIK